MAAKTPTGARIVVSTATRSDYGGGSREPVRIDEWPKTSRV